MGAEAFEDLIDKDQSLRAMYIETSSTSWVFKGPLRLSTD